MRIKGISHFSAIRVFWGMSWLVILRQIGEGVTGLQVGDQVSVVPYMHCGTCIACRNGKTNCCTDMKVLGVHIDGGMRELFPCQSAISLRPMG